MSEEINAGITFFQNVIGQMVLIGGGIVAAIKFLEHRQNKKIDEIVDKQLQPFKTDICNQLASLKSSLETQQRVNELQLDYIQKAIDTLEGHMKSG